MQTSRWPLSASTVGLEAQRADEVGELDERAERLGPPPAVVPQGRQQVGLADAEAAVEVDARGRRRVALRRREPPAARAALSSARGIPSRRSTAAAWLGWAGSGR